MISVPRHHRLRGRTNGVRPPSLGVPGAPALPAQVAALREYFEAKTGLRSAAEIAAAFKGAKAKDVEPLLKGWPTWGCWWRRRSKKEWFGRACEGWLRVSRCTGSQR